MFMFMFMRKLINHLLSTPKNRDQELDPIILLYLSYIQERGKTAQCSSAHFVITLSASSSWKCKQNHSCNGAPRNPSLLLLPKKEKETKQKQMKTNQGSTEKSSRVFMGPTSPLILFHFHGCFLCCSGI